MLNYSFAFEIDKYFAETDQFLVILLKFTLFFCRKRISKTEFAVDDRCSSHLINHHSQMFPSINKHVTSSENPIRKNDLVEQNTKYRVIYFVYAVAGHFGYSLCSVKKIQEKIFYLFCLSVWGLLIFYEVFFPCRIRAYETLYTAICGKNCSLNK